MRLLRALRRDDSGASAVEFAILVPALLSLLLGTITLFDLFRAQQTVEKATFTVGDVLSRQSSVNQAFLDDMRLMLTKLISTPDPVAIRVSSIGNRNGALFLEWSHTSGGARASALPIPYEKVPLMAPGDTIILTETFADHPAIFAGFGISDVSFANHAVHRPRLTTQLTWQ